MLVLSRKRKEAIVIKHPDGTRTVVRVIRCSMTGSRVRLGITADDSVIVVREELEERTNDPTP